MKKIIYLAFFLGLVSSIVTVTLASVNHVTAPIIQEIQEAAFRQAVEYAFPHADFFQIIAEEEDIYSNHIVQILEIFQNYETIGYIYTQNVPGFGGPINYVIGIDTEGNFNSFVVLSHSETPGFGARIENDYFRDLFNNTYAGHQIDAFTGATTTTNAIKSGLIDLYQDFITRGGN